MPKPEPWKLDPTYLEQTGLDPQQLQKEIDAAVKQAVSQAQSTSSSAPAASSQLSPSSAAPSTPSYNVVQDAAAAQTSNKPKPDPWKLDPTYLEQAGLDPQQVRKEIDTAVRQAVSTPSASASAGGSPQPGSPARRPSILDIIYMLDPAAADPSAVDSFYNTMKNLQLTLWTSGGQPSGGGTPTGGGQPSSGRDYTKGRGLWGASGQPSGGSTPSGIGIIPVDYLLDQRNPENVVNRLSTAYEHLRKELDQTVSKYSDVLAYSGGRIGMSPQLQSLLDRYQQALNELKSSLPDVEKTLRDKFGDYVKVSNGRVDLAPDVKALVDRANEFALLYSNILQNYNSALFDLVKRYGLEIKNNTLVVPPDKYDQVKAELEALNKKMEDDLAKLYSQYRDVVNRRVADGRVVYEYKPEAQAALALQSQVAQAVKDLAAAQQQALQNVVNKYSDVLSYDKKTGKITPSSDLAALLNKYEQVVQEAGNIINAMSTVAGMIPTFAQQLPVFKVTFQTYDRSQNQWVEVGGETPIYIKDESLRKEVADWMSRNKDKVEVVALHDPNSRGRPYVVYVFNKDTKEGYVIDPVEGTGFYVKGTEVGRVYNPATGEWEQLKGIDVYLREKTLGMWLSSLTDEEKELLKRRERIEQLGPGFKDLYAALMGAGRFAVITPAIDVLIRWAKGEDPTKGLREFELEAAAAAEASPLAHAVGQAVGLAGVGGLTAEGLIAKGASLGASGVGRQFLAGLRSALKPAVAGTVAGATFGAAEGVLTGRDPLAEASKFGAIGLMTGLGGVAREQLITAGLLSGVVGATTAKKYGVEKGLEAGSAVFPLAFAAPEWLSRGLGGVAMETAVARRPKPAVGLKSEPVPAVEAEYAQIVRNVASRIRSRMEAKPLPGLTPEDAAVIAARLRANPGEQRAFFMQLAEDAAAKIRAGDDVALVQLRLLRDKLDPVSRMRFDEVLRQYGLTEVKAAAPEYSLREEEAQKLARLFRREPEYQLTDESAKALNRFLRQTPEYKLDDAVAQQLNLFLKMPKREYALTDEAAVRLDQLLKMEPPLTGMVSIEVTEAARPKIRNVLTGKTAVELAGQPRLEPPLAGRSELEASAKSQPELRPALTAKTEIQLPGVQRQEPRVEAGSQLRLPEVQKSAFVRVLKTGAELIPEVAMTPEIKQAVEWAQEAGRKLWELNVALRAGTLPPQYLPAIEAAVPEKERRPLAVKPPMPQVETPPPVPEKEWRPFEAKPLTPPPASGAEPPNRERKIIPTLPALQIEPPSTVKPPYEIPKSPEDEPKYNPPPLTTATPPPTADVPPPPAYTPVPTYEMPPVYTPRGGVPQPDVPKVPLLEGPPPTPLPPGWWRLLPPSMFTEDTKEGAYRVQEGKKQILLLA